MATYELGPDRFVIARPEDLLHLEVRLDEDGPAVVFDLPSQHVMEFPRGKVVADRIVVPALGADRGFDFISYHFPTAEALALGEGVLTRLDGQAGRGHVELPTMVQLRTLGHGTWNLHPRPRAGAGWTAVWTADLIETSGELPGVPGRLLEVFSTQDPGFEPPGFGIDPFTAYPQLRQAVFQASLAYSMLGASASIHGPFFPPSPPGGLDVELASYDHTTQFGRDQSVTTVLRGTLSSGHPAQLALVTRREFARMLFGGPFDSASFVAGNTYVSARLFETASLTVTDPVVDFSTRETPFRTLRITDLEVGQVDPPASSPATWVTRNGADVRFGLVATDWAGREVPFSAPLMFLRAGAASAPDDVATQFATGDARRREIDLGGARVALADVGGRDDISFDNVTLPVHRVAFGLKAQAVGAVGAVGGGALALVPSEVDVALESVGRLTAQAKQARCVLVDKVNETGQFLDIIGGLPVELPATQVGGLANPDTVLRAVDAVKGAIPGGTVGAMFGQAKVLGASILDLLPDLPGPPPELTSVELPDQVTTTYEWNPALRPGTTAGFIGLEPGSTLHLKGTVVMSVDPTGGQPRLPVTTVEGELTKATISLLGMVMVRFERIRFEDLPDKAPAVTVDGVKVTFGKDLRFVEELAKAIQDFAKGSPVDVDSTGIRAGYDLSIGNLSLGAFALSNIKLVAAAHVPFDGRPAYFRFGFGERHAPFNVRVSYFAGGGFFAFRASTARLELVEGSLEFGGSFDFSVLVATGQVQAMGGVTFQLSERGATVGGYLRCSGHVEVLDILSATVEFEMGLSYSNDGTRAVIRGYADLTISVSVLLLHESVSFRVEKELPADSLFDSPVELVLDTEAWDQLCDAFA